MNEKIKELRELKRMKEELEAAMDAIKDEIKSIMTESNQEEMTGTDWKVTYKSVTSSRFDSKAFKADHAKLAELYTRTTATRRLTIA